MSAQVQEVEPKRKQQSHSGVRHVTMADVKGSGTGCLISKISAEKMQSLSFHDSHIEITGRFQNECLQKKREGTNMKE